MRDAVSTQIMDVLGLLALLAGVFVASYLAAYYLDSKYRAWLRERNLTSALQAHNAALIASLDRLEASDVGPASG